MAAPMERLWDSQKGQQRAVLLENQKAWRWAAKKAAPMAVTSDQHWADSRVEQMAAH